MSAVAAAAINTISMLPGSGGDGGRTRSSSSSSSSSSSTASSSSSSSSSFFCVKKSSTNRSAAIRAAISKQQQQNNNAATTSTPTPTSSPLRVAEEIASQFGLEMAIADLERLFSSSPTSTGGGGADPQNAGPSGRPVRVAYQGVRGSYCQEAAAEAFSSSTRLDSSSMIPCAHMEDAFAALESGAADRAIVPVENSIDGPIHRNFDLLLRHPGVQIVGEVVIPVNHCLLALPGTSVSAVRHVVSHPQALRHCRGRLAALGVGEPSLEVEEVPNAADAARILAEDRIGDTAVIGSRIAAREFGLTVLEENFQDDCLHGGNYTRFLQLALRPRPSSSSGEGRRRRRATVALALEEGVSGLFRTMWIFESRGVKVTRVDHRPNRSNPIRVVEKAGAASYFDYVFILDVEADSQPAVQTAVDRLSEICGFVRVLGSYACE